MIENSEIRKAYSELQKQLFYLIPEKWDKIYLYASVEEKKEGLETGELFFYYYPRGILKKNPINVYEIPNKFSLNEEEYIKLVEKLYDEIKQIWKIFKKENHKLWTNITVRIEGLKFEIEYNYEKINYSKYSNMDRHIIWKYFNLGLPDEAFTSKERKVIKSYINETIYFKPDTEKYTEAIYKNPVKKILDYNREKIEQVYIPETEMQKLAKNAKAQFDKQHYTYKVKEKKKLKYLLQAKKEKTTKPKTYIEQIEEQRNSVRSQILTHM